MFKQRIEFCGGTYIFVGQGITPEEAKADAVRQAKLHQLTEEDITKEHEAYRS